MARKSSFLVGKTSLSRVGTLIWVLRSVKLSEQLGFQYIERYLFTKFDSSLVQARIPQNNIHVLSSSLELFVIFFKNLADEADGNESDEDKGETSWKNSKTEASENAGLPGDNRPQPQSGLPEAQPSPEPEPEKEVSIIFMKNDS